MHLHGTTQLANGYGYYRNSYEHSHSQPTTSSTMTFERSCHRTYTPSSSSRSPPASLQSSPSGHAKHYTATSRSPPSTSSGVSAPSANSLVSTSCGRPGDGGVFLPNCKLSADFLQLRTDAHSPPTPGIVRLYLTASELVVKRPTSYSTNGRTRESTWPKQESTSGTGADVSILHYPLQDLDVSTSRVAPRTMVVTLSQTPPHEDRETTANRACTCSHSSREPAKSQATDSVVPITTTTTTSTITTMKCGSTTTAVASLSGRECCFNNKKTVLRGSGGSGPQLLVVEAYQLLLDQGSIDDWLSGVEKGKQKLSLLNKHDHTNRKSNEPTQSPVPPSPIRPTTIPLHSLTAQTPAAAVAAATVGVGVGRRRGNHVYRRSLSNHDFPSISQSTPVSPVCEKRPTTSSGRYTVLHHHYSPHPLFSSSSLPQSSRIATPSAVPLQHLEKESRKLFRRLSLGGTYRFPSNCIGKIASKGESSHDHSTTKESKGRTTYMYSLRQDECPTESLSQPTLSSHSQCNSPSRSPSLARRYDCPARSSHRDFLRKKRHPVMSRSLSECHNSESESKEEVHAPFVNGHQRSKPIPVATGTSNSGSNTAGVSTPPELKALQAFLTSLPSPTPPPSHTPSSLSDDDRDGDDDNARFQSFLRHKQIRGRKIHVSPRAHTSSVSSDHHLLSPPAWVDSHSSRQPLTKGISATLPRSHKLVTSASKTTDNEAHSGSSSPVPKLSKTPKIFKRLHRRWQSSSGVKLEQEMMGADDFNPPEKLYQLPPKDVAEGLTGMDAELLERISPDEIRDGAWMKRGEKEKLAPNVLVMVHSFNQLALLVPTEVLREPTRQQRAKVITAYIQIANKCYNLKNYNSLKAILAGLQSTPVYRLQKTWKEIPSKKKKRYDQLCKLMSEEDNWQRYRNEIDTCLASSTPCIPYLGQFLTQVCHQLSYNKMRAEKEEVTDRRGRSRRFPPLTTLGGGGEREKEAVELRLSSSFRKSSQLAVNTDKRASTTSLSAPASPVALDDETEEVAMRFERARIQQQQRSTEAEDNQSLEFELSLSLDSRALNSPMSPHPPTSSGTDTSGSSYESRKRTTATLSSRHAPEKGLTAFHSTPVKDANGYIQPLRIPFPRGLNFDESSMSQGFDEPDFGNSAIASDVDVSNDLANPLDAERSNTNATEDAVFRMKIPSISLQRNSSHSSLEGWEDEQEFAIAKRTISKSRSLESCLMSPSREAADRDVNVMVAPRNRLTLSQSIPSLDSDSVFSIEDDEGEGEGGERMRRKIEQEISVDSEISIEGNEPVSRKCTQSLPITALASCSAGGNALQRMDTEPGRELSFSPLESSLESSHHHGKYDRAHSSSPVSSSLEKHDPNQTREDSFSPASLSTENDQRERELCTVNSSPEANLFEQSDTKTQHYVHRSKSVGSATYRHKWRWKKGAALASSSNAAGNETRKTLTTTDPFDLLHTFQSQSRDCYPVSVCRVDFKTILNKFQHNSEDKNYELSFEREP